MDPELLHARRIASAFASKPDAVPDIAATAPEALARQVLLAQPGIAIVEEVHVTKRWGRTRSVAARVRVEGTADARDVCCCAAEALARHMRLDDVCLTVASAPGDTEISEGTP